MELDKSYKIPEEVVYYYANQRNLISRFPTLATHDGKSVVVMGRGAFRMDEGNIWFAMKTIYGSRVCERLTDPDYQHDNTGFTIVVDAI